jgi:hypothetical protein
MDDSNGLKLFINENETRETASEIMEMGTDEVLVTECPK